jgi:hypothetical protein
LKKEATLDSLGLIRDASNPVSSLVDFAPHVDGQRRSAVLRLLEAAEKE